jgi:hypothetical protein
MKTKDKEVFHYSRSPNLDKYYINKDFVTIKNVKKPLPKKGKISQTNIYSDLKYKPNEKQVISSIKNKKENFTKDTQLFNVSKKGKGKSLEKDKIENSRRIRNNIMNLNKKKDKNKNINDIGIKIKANNINIKKNNSVGKSSNLMKNTNKNNNIKNSKNNINNYNNNNKSDKTKQNKTNKIIKNENNLNEFSNLDDLQNINIEQEQLNQMNYHVPSNYINYNIINNNISSSKRLVDPSDNIPFKKYNSVCVSINNNYNYNVSLKPSKPEDINNIINQTIIKQTKNNFKNKEIDNN